MSQRLNIVLAGHVDHGKSTIVGRLLADSGALPDGKLAQVKAYCERNARPFEYAFLVDALKNEQAQGVTIDSARVFFRTGDREYVFIDAPGHVEFVRNMVTGASRADAAFLVIDANEGIQENSRRHGKLLGLLGIQQVVVLVNKMDLVGFAQETFDAVTSEYSSFLREAGVAPMQFIPVCGTRGDNVAQSSTTMTWYSGPTVTGVLESFRLEKPPSEKPFRLWVQGVYKFTNDGDTRRIIAGTVESGSISVGDRIVFYPSGKKSTVKNIESFPPASRSTASAGEAIGLTLTEQIYVSRGELAIKVGESRPHVTSRLRSSIFWLGKEPMRPEKEYLLKIGTARVPCKIETIRSVQDASTLATSESKQLDRYTIADCDLELDRAMAFDLAEDVLTTGRFVIVDQFEIRGGGIMREAEEDRQTWVQRKRLIRDHKWESSTISAEERASRFGQRPALIVISGKKDSGKKPLARALEAKLHGEGFAAYFLGIGNVLYGVDADIKGAEDVREEHIRRFAEVAHVLLDAGVIVVATAIELTDDDLEMIKLIVNPDKIITVWVGEDLPDNLESDLQILGPSHLDTGVDALQILLAERGITQEADARQVERMARDVGGKPPAFLLRRRPRIKVLSSLPRSGTHWLRLMISYVMGTGALQKRLIDPDELQRALESDGRARLLFDHFESDAHGEILDPNKYPDLRMVLLYRNPLDAFISRYYSEWREGGASDLYEGPVEILRRDLFRDVTSCALAGEEQIGTTRPESALRWDLRVHVVDWLRWNRCLPVKYEDLIADTEGQLVRVLDYLEIGTTKDRLLDAVDVCRFEYLSGGRPPGIIDRTSHYRRGVPGEWREVFDTQMFNSSVLLLGDYMKTMGYSIEEEASSQAEGRTNADERPPADRQSHNPSQRVLKEWNIEAILAEIQLNSYGEQIRSRSETLILREDGKLRYVSTDLRDHAATPFVQITGVETGQPYCLVAAVRFSETIDAENAPSIVLQNSRFVTLDEIHPVGRDSGLEITLRSGFRGNSRDVRLILYGVPGREVAFPIGISMRLVDFGIERPAGSGDIVPT